MDVNQFEWDIVQHKSGYWQSTLFPRLPVLLPLAALAGYKIVTFCLTQPYFRTYEIMIALLGVEAVGLVVLNHIWYLIYRASGLRLTHYKVSGEGVEIDRKKYPLSDFSSSATDTFIDGHALPYAEWKQVRPADGKPLLLAFDTARGKIKLLFPEEYIRQKCLRTLKDCLHPSQT